MKKFCLALLAVAVLGISSGCTTKINHNDIVTTDAQKLEKNQIVYVGLAKDGAYGDKTYSGTGAQVGHQLAKHLSPYVDKVNLATEVLSQQEAVQAAREKGARYVFIPVITHWEPRQAAWSGRPTRASIAVSVYDTVLKDTILIRNINIEGRTMTFVSQSVNVLSDTAIGQFCESIF